MNEKSLPAENASNAGSVCRSGAISITADGYRIDDAKCVRCKLCVNQAVLENGCLMGKYLRTKGGI